MLHLLCGEETAPSHIWYNLWMLVRQCPGLTVYKSLDQPQCGIKLTTVQIQYSTCGWDRELATYRVKKQVGFVYIVKQSHCSLEVGHILPAKYYKDGVDNG